MSADPSNPSANGPPPETPPNPTGTTANDPVEPLEGTSTLPDTEKTAGSTVAEKEKKKPPKPIMGDITDPGDGIWSAWTGGQPKADWTGLD